MLKEELRVISAGTITPLMSKLSITDLGASLQSREMLYARDYVMEATISAKFCANDAMLEHQSRIAKAYILEMVYRDVRIRLNQLRMSVNSCDTQKALEIIDEIDSATRS